MSSLVSHAGGHELDSVKCMQKVQSIRTKGALKFLCAVDGSSFSDTALSCAVSLLKKNDHLNVFHAFSSEDDLELPPHLQSSNLKEGYKSKLALLQKSRYTLIWEERYVDETQVILPVKTMLIKATDGRLEECASDFLIVGFTGHRKHDSMHSPNHDGHGVSYQEDNIIGGSHADFTLRFIHIPTIVVKKEVSSGGKLYVMAVDASNLSKLGLDVVYTLLTPKDEIIVIHVCDDDVNEVDTIKQYYEEDLEAYCPTSKHKFQFIVNSTHENAAYAIQDFVEDIGADFLAVAPRSRSDGSFASLTEQLVKLVRTNIIMCKL